MQKRYTSAELKEFEAIIYKKLEKAITELKVIMETLGGKQGNSANSALKMLEDGAEIAEKEDMSQLAERQRKFIAQLEDALVRINNGTYGVCIVTGELIDKERLKLVPHTRHSLAAKLIVN